MYSWKRTPKEDDKDAKDNIDDLTTFSIDYVGNENNFVSNDYQISKIVIMLKLWQNF